MRGEGRGDRGRRRVGFAGGCGGCDSAPLSHASTHRVHEAREHLVLVDLQVGVKMPARRERGAMGGWGGQRQSARGRRFPGAGSATACSSVRYRASARASHALRHGPGRLKRLRTISTLYRAHVRPPSGLRTRCCAGFPWVPAPTTRPGSSDSPCDGDAHLVDVAVGPHLELQGVDVLPEHRGLHLRARDARRMGRAGGSMR